jgi:hypothetical protein
MLAHVELVDRVVALLEADLGEDRLGGDQVGRPGRRHDLRALEVLDASRPESPCATTNCSIW